MTTTVTAMATSMSLMTTSLKSPTARKLLEDLDAELVGLYPDHPYPPPFGDEEAAGVGSVLIAYADRRAVGCGAIRRLDGTTAELLRMYVLPTSRGKGIGKRSKKKRPKWALREWYSKPAISSTTPSACTAATATPMPQGG